jgi:hypothetical protein
MQAGVVFKQATRTILLKIRVQYCPIKMNLFIGSVLSFKDKPLILCYGIKDNVVGFKQISGDYQAVRYRLFEPRQEERLLYSIISIVAGL